MNAFQKYHVPELKWQDVAQMPDSELAMLRSLIDAGRRQAWHEKDFAAHEVLKTRLAGVSDLICLRFQARAFQPAVSLNFTLTEGSICQ